MVQLSKAVYGKNFSYTNTDGTTETIRLLPLTGNYIPTLFKIAKQFQKIDKSLTPEEIANQTLDLLNDETLTQLIEVSVETIRKSCPDNSEEDIKNFVSSHLFELFPIIIDFNLSQSKNK